MNGNSTDNLIFNANTQTNNHRLISPPRTRRFRLFNIRTTMVRSFSFALMSVAVVGCTTPTGNPGMPAPAPRAAPKLVKPDPNLCTGLTKFALLPGSAPAFPVAAFQKYQEGWVQVEYDVEAGKVVRARVIDSSPPQLFDATALDTTLRMTYSEDSNGRSCQIEHEYKLEPTRWQ
ncbi:energy transducer TonB [Niveibacterium sp. COAC-50]|uniref:energy transducer TonB n=1 Tax=Niveibacterium sp. COAC-50 TaxID=2729384 RepID=UPI0015544E5C|nr:energy transducer TonB [Niveibacterium sp. COAC-50]